MAKKKEETPVIIFKDLSGVKDEIINLAWKKKMNASELFRHLLDLGLAQFKKK